MSSIELGRLRADLEGNLEFEAEFSGLDDIEARTQLAVARGYDVAVADIAELAEGELDEADLEMVAGGWDSASGGG